MFRLFFHSGGVFRVVVLAMSVQGWPYAEKEFERVAKIVAVIAIESVRPIIDCELRAETDVYAVSVR